MSDALPPLFHTLCLVWSHSRCYRTAQRMVVLLQEFCNLVIEKVQRETPTGGGGGGCNRQRLWVSLQAFGYLIPEELFKMELEEGVERVQMTIGVLQTFKQLFHAHRRNIPKYFRDAAAVRPWDFPPGLVFQRSDRIMERLRMIEVPRGAPTTNSDRRRSSA